VNGARKSRRRGKRERDRVYRRRQDEIPAVEEERVTTNAWLASGVHTL
jgi:hypothetical protein